MKKKTPLILVFPATLKTNVPKFFGQKYSNIQIIFSFQNCNEYQYLEEYV